MDASFNSRLFWMLQECNKFTLKNYLLHCKRILQLLNDIIVCYVRKSGRANNWLNCVGKLDHIYQQYEDCKEYINERGYSLLNFSTLSTERELVQEKCEQLMESIEKLDEVLIHIVSSHKLHRNRRVINCNVNLYDKFFNIPELWGVITSFLTVKDIGGGLMMTCWGLFNFALYSPYSLMVFKDDQLEKRMEFNPFCGLDVLRFCRVEILHTLKPPILKMIRDNRTSIRQMVVLTNTVPFSTGSADQLDDDDDESSIVNSSSSLMFMEAISGMKNVEDLVVVIEDTPFSDWHFETTGLFSPMKGNGFPHLKRLEIRTDFSEKVVKRLCSIPNLTELHVVLKIEEFENLPFKVIFDTLRKVNKCRSMSLKEYNELSIYFKLSNTSYERDFVYSVGYRTSEATVRCRRCISHLVTLKCESGLNLVHVRNDENLVGNFSVSNILRKLTSIVFINGITCEVKNEMDVFSVVLCLLHCENKYLVDKRVEIVVDGVFKNMMGIPTQLLLCDVIQRKEMEYFRIFFSKKAKRNNQSFPTIMLREKFENAVKVSKIPYLHLDIFEKEKNWIEDVKNLLKLESSYQKKKKDIVPSILQIPRYLLNMFEENEKEVKYRCEKLLEKKRKLLNSKRIKKLRNAKKSTSKGSLNFVRRFRSSSTKSRRASNSKKRYESKMD